MGVISNTDIADKYTVSKPAVTFWVRDAQLKKNNLILEEVNNKFKVVDNEHNHNELLRLSAEGRKFRRNSMHAEIEPKPEFYEIFSDSEIVEIVRDLEVFREINYKFTYKNGGAKAWDDFYKKSVQDGSYKPPIRIKNLLYNSFGTITQRIPKNTKVNIIEIGPGNSLPVKEFLESLDQLKLLNKYVAVDISPEMIDLSQKNINSWLPQIQFSGYVCDIENGRLNDIFEKEKLQNPDTVNIVLMLGGTIGNHRNRLEVLRNIGEGLRKNDLFILSNATDLADNKAAFSYLSTKESMDQDLWIPSLLGFNVFECEMIRKYDDEKNRKVMLLKFDKDYSIIIKEMGYTKTLNFIKGQEILLWKHYSTKPATLFSEFEQCGLNLVSFNTENDFSHALMICELNAFN